MMYQCEAEAQDEGKGNAGVGGLCGGGLIKGVFSKERSAIEEGRR